MSAILPMPVWGRKRTKTISASEHERSLEQQYAEVAKIVNKVEELAVELMTVSTQAKQSFKELKEE